MSQLGHGGKLDSGSRCVKWWANNRIDLTLIFIFVPFDCVCYSFLHFVGLDQPLEQLAVVNRVIS